MVSKATVIEVRILYPGRTVHGLTLLIDDLGSFGDVAQFGGAPAWLAGGYGFESRRLHEWVLASPLAPFVQVLETGDAFRECRFVEAACWCQCGWPSSGICNPVRRVALADCGRCPTEVVRHSVLALTCF